SVKWHTIQEELLNCNDGGVQFFDTCDHILDDPGLPHIIHRAYFMILSNGFYGNYFDNANHRDKVIQRFQHFINQNCIEHSINNELEPRIVPNINIKKKSHYYTPTIMVNTAITLFSIAAGSYIGGYIYLSL
ncbi:DotU family type IV/VI secretion system protein, partial [Francisellaceae bacterium]|nr:DotU family type IV/VI secretion system protein [Francisellaceae bacterium]